ncbi:MAG: twin-arginine translocation signal domain-containing protein, partial [Planctomycetaceae bacterium]
MSVISRRDFLTHTAATSGLAAGLTGQHALGTLQQSEIRFRVSYPRPRIPVSFIIDASTCLVNMGHFCMPQFAAAWPERDIYRKPWKTWPREIPDAFVR